MSSIEVIGMIGVNRERDSSRGVTVSLFGGGINPADEIPSGIDPEYIAEFCQAHEQAGFDKVLIGYSSATADGFAVAGYAATRTETLGYLIAHRAGFMAPTPGRPTRRHPRPAFRRPHRPARHLRRQRRGAAARRRLAGPRFPLPPHRGMDGYCAPHLDRVRPLRLPGRVLPLGAGPQPGQDESAAPRPALLRRRVGGGNGGRRAPRRRLRSLGRAGGRHQGADCRHPRPRLQVRARDTV